MKKLKVGVIGYGQRGTSMTKGVLCKMDNVEIAMVCDLYEDRVEKAQNDVLEKTGKKPRGTTVASEVINDSEVETVFIFAAWEAHIPLAIESMKAGKPVALEVAGAYSIEQCWDLVHTYEQTKTPVMMLENCCYGRREMMVLKMVREGLFGKVVHCDGGYGHDLRYEVAGGIKNRHYRLRNYASRSCDNYPTHQLGPIAQVLDINRGNRFLTVSSVASKSVGIRDYIERNLADDETLANMEIRQGDVVTTVITCALGQTVRLTLDTCLPRFYSRDFAVHGTKAYYQELNDSFYFEDNPEHTKLHEVSWKPQWGNAKEYEEQYDHPVWKRYIKEGMKGGHGGIDWLVVNDFVNHVVSGEPMPIDVYDIASLMCITTLSEQSVAMHGAPQAVPDFTNGAWLLRK